MNGWHGMRMAAQAALGLVLAGCALGPSGKPPAMPEPVRYVAGPAPDAAPAGSPDLVAAWAPDASWWTAFGAPELDALVAHLNRTGPSCPYNQGVWTAANFQEEIARLAA